MHLKNIELYGFKSFANKMTFKFDKGITGIVGPNGSGKSNIADAVRWVLGEQRAKQLRGGKMQDVIFAGTEARKPLGYCQVDLTIDNHDMKMPIEYSEVTVSRRVYRSGEGEYFINGTSCRLRDVQELFMDTGVGQEGYSIIGQGQIDKILSNKPDERRALFDEAVGIVKFKKRKSSAEKRLTDEKQNLLRVNDIISELEGQKDTLTFQAEKAKQYLTIKETLKINEVNVFILDVKNIEDELKTLAEKEAIAQENISSVKRNYQENKEQHTKHIEEIEHLQNELEAIRNQKTALQIEKEKKESEISLTKEQILHISSNNTRFEEDIATIDEQLDEGESELHSYKASMASLFSASEENEQSLKSEEMALEALNVAIEEEEKTVSDIQSNMIERLNEISAIRSQRQRFHTLAENATSRRDTILNRKTILKASVESLTNNRDEEKKNRHQINREIKGLSTEKQAIKEEQLVKRNEWVQLENKRKQQQEKVQKLDSKYKALFEISDQYEGYNYSIKTVMSQKDNGQYKGKICGVVADVLTVSPKYERAIEVALGGNYQNIITEDESSAKSLIRYLKERRAGRATFLPLTNIRPRINQNASINNQPGVIGYADSLVHAEVKYMNVIKHLLGRVIITDTIDHAIALGKKHNNTLRIVTLDGDVVNPGGSMTGGAYKNDKTHFLSRKRELETLNQALVDGKELLQSIEKQYQELLENKNEQDKRLTIINESMQDNTIKLNNLNMMIHQLDSEIKKLEMELQGLQDEESQIKDQESDLTGQLSALDASLKEYEVSKETAESTVKNLMSTTIALKEQKEALVERITKLRIDFHAREEQLNHAKSNIDRMSDEINRLKERKSKLSQEIQSNMVLKEEKSKRISVYREDIEKYSEIIEEVDVKRETLNNKRIEITDKQEVLYASQEKLSDTITGLEKEVLRLQNQIQKYETQKENYIEYMWDEYELTYNNALEFLQDDLGSIGIIKKRIERLKGEIRGLGDVNVNAIEDYKSVVERYEFLSEQRNDIIEAEEKLREIIGELDRQMQHQFKEQFTAINHQFQYVFKELFGGGKAFLRLSDEDDVLEAGIHINVQPPGKKLQSMMLLSGGERALTAIALLFAIQNLKPSPFCVLDEIEAALDDANVDRFANYLQKLTDNTQFIIITHRRGTMEAADALYGITMQEKGVSTQVSVQLIEDVLEV